MKSQTTRGAVLLDQPPSGQHLLARNVSHETLVFGGPGFGEIALGVQEEQVLPATWAKNKGLRKFVQEKRVAVSWVSETYEPRILPVIQEAPPDILPDDKYQQNFAMQIALSGAEHAKEMIGVTARQGEAREIDINYMTTNFRKILKLADWLEERIQNRKPVRRAINDRLAEIRKM